VSRSLTLQKQINRYAPIHLEPDVSFSFNHPLAWHAVHKYLTI